jgi:AAA domain
VTTRLPTSPAHQLELRPARHCWLIDGLWADQAVGIVGGEPKCCKSFLALDIALAVASGAPCLRRFPPTHPGRVLLYAAEDAPHVVRQRLHGIALAAEVEFASLDIQVITALSLRLDLPADQERLRNTVQALRPTLLVLDPFVRLHRIDENAAAEVAPVLGYLRELQRHFHTAVLLVHHARKGASHLRAGQALRGSSELHAWGDSNLYLRRQGATLRLTVEHRAAPGHDGLLLDLRADGDAIALHLVDPHGRVDDRDQGPASPPPSRLAHIEQVLATLSAPIPRRQLRRACRMRDSALGDALGQLLTAGRVVKCAAGYQLAPP